MGDNAVNETSPAIASGAVHILPARWGADDVDIHPRQLDTYPKHAVGEPGRTKGVVIAALCVLTLGFGSWSVLRVGPADNLSVPRLPQSAGAPADGSELGDPASEPAASVPGEPTPSSSTTTRPGVDPRAAVGPPGNAVAPSKDVSTLQPVYVPVNQPTRQPLAINTVHALQWAGKTDQYLVRVGDLSNMGWVTSGSSAATKTAANFAVVAGLADPTCFSFTAGGRYLRHSYFRLRWDFNDGSTLFTKDATFCVRTGAVSESISLQSKNYPNYFVTKVDDELWIKQVENTAAYRANISFYSVTACA